MLAATNDRTVLAPASPEAPTLLDCPAALPNLARERPPADHGHGAPAASRPLTAAELAELLVEAAIRHDEVSLVDVRAHELAGLDLEVGVVLAAHDPWTQAHALASFAVELLGGPDAFRERALDRRGMTIAVLATLEAAENLESMVRSTIPDPARSRILEADVESLERVLDNVCFDGHAEGAAFAAIMGARAALVAAFNPSMAPSAPNPEYAGRDALRGVVLHRCMAKPSLAPCGVALETLRAIERHLEDAVRRFASEESAR